MKFRERLKITSQRLALRKARLTTKKKNPSPQDIASEQTKIDHIVDHRFSGQRKKSV